MAPMEIYGQDPPVATIYYQDYWHPIAGGLGLLLVVFALAAGGLAPSQRGVIVFTTGIVIGIGFFVVVVQRPQSDDWPTVDLYRSDATLILAGIDHSPNLHWQTYLGLMASVVVIALGVVKVLPVGRSRRMSASGPTAPEATASVVAPRLFHHVRNFAVPVLVALGVYLAVFAGMVKAIGQDVAVGTAIGTALLTLAALWVYRNFGFAFVRPYLPNAWTALCLVLFVLLWTPYESHQIRWSGYLDGTNLALSRNHGLCRKSGAEGADLQTHHYS